MEDQGKTQNGLRRKMVSNQLSSTSMQFHVANGIARADRARITDNT